MIITNDRSPLHTETNFIQMLNENVMALRITWATISCQSQQDVLIKNSINKYLINPIENNVSI